MEYRKIFIGTVVVAACIVLTEVYQVLDERVPIKTHLEKLIDVTYNGFLGLRHKFRFEDDGTYKLTKYPYKAACNKTFISQHYMTIREPQGRTGNNLFQLMMLLGTSIDHCYTPVISYKFAKKLNRVFDLSFVKPIVSVPENWSIFAEFSDTMYSVEVETLDHKMNWTFFGYFQSWRYFEKSKDFIKSKLHFRKNLIDAVSTYFNSKPQFTNKTKICVHARRTDFLDPLLQAVGFSSADGGYFNRSMEFFRKRLKDKSIVFIYVSDDIAWCKANLKGADIFYSPFNKDSPAKDMALISSCDHNIISSGSFGWTASWLGSGTVVYYKGYPEPGSIRDRRTSRYDYYPPSWIGLL